MSTGLSLASFFLIVVYTIANTGVVGQDNGANNGEMGEMRAMLRTALTQNKKLEQQNRRLQMLWSGLKTMCSALNVRQCDCENKSTQVTEPYPDVTKTTNPTPLLPPPITSTTPVTTTTTHTPTTTTTQQPTELPLQVLSVQSRGLSAKNNNNNNNSNSNDIVDLNVFYTSPDNHTTEWIIVRQNNAILRTGGVKDKKLNTRSSMVSIDNWNVTTHALFRIYTLNESVSLHINLSAIEDAGEQVMLQIPMEKLAISETYVAPSSTDLNIKVNLDGEPKQNAHLLKADMFFTGVNTTTEPPSLFEIASFGNTSLGLSLNPSVNNSSNLVITLRQPYVQYGGILTFRLPQSVNGFVQQFSYGQSIKIFAPNTQEIVPYNTIGVYRLPKQTLLVKPSQSIVCAAMGNPRPEISLLKIEDDGALTATATETILLDNTTNMQALNIVPATNTNVEGKYMCRAENGMKTVTTYTDVVLREPMKFDDASTGVILNQTTTAIVLACQASGSPRPNLKMNLYFETGPDLEKSGLYKLTRTTLDRYTNRLTLSISPVDRKLHTVYCVAEQNGQDNYRKIEVYPGTNTPFDWIYLDNIRQRIERRMKNDNGVVSAGL